MKKNEIVGSNDTINELQQFGVSNQLVQNANKNAILSKYDMEMVHINNFIEHSGNNKSKIQKSLDTYSKYSHQKILEYANLGLSIANGDYYIIPYGDKPKFEVDYKGMLKIASNEARKNGFQLIAKADTVRDGFTKLEVSTNGLIDNIILENGKLNAEIKTSYCILALMDIETRSITMQKVEVLPIVEYLNAVKASKGGNVHKDYKSEMAKKIVLRRAVKILNTMFASDILDKLFNLDNESYNLKANEPKPKQIANINNILDN